VRVPLDTFYADIPEPGRPQNMISMLMTEIAAQTVDSCNITVPQDKDGRVHKTSTTALVFVTLLVYLIQIGAATKLLMNGRSYDYRILQDAVCTVPLRRPERAGSQCCRATGRRDASTAAIGMILGFELVTRAELPSRPRWTKGSRMSTTTLPSPSCATLNRSGGRACDRGLAVGAVGGGGGPCHPSPRPLRPARRNPGKYNTDKIRYA
jgi:hypothetical protein